MQKDSEFLKNLRHEYRLTQEVLAKNLGVTKSYIGLVESGKSKLSAKILDKIICLYPDTNQKVSEECITIERIHIKPSCGSGTIVMGEAEITPVLLGKKLLQNIFRISNIEALKVFTASGDSMEDTIYHGDDVLVDTSCNSYTNGGIFIIEKFGDWFIKRLRLRFDGSLEIISDNSKKYQPEIVKLDSGVNINIKGRVIKNLSRGL